MKIISPQHELNPPLLPKTGRSVDLDLICVIMIESQTHDYDVTG
jgi:hypothetical protein